MPGYFVKSGGMRGSSFVFAKLPLMMLPADILKESRVSTKTEFMW